MDAPLLEVEGLTVEVSTSRGVARVLDRVSLRLERGRVLAIVGESGGGKTLLGLTLLGLLPEGTARVASGQARFRGRDLLALDAAALRAMRGRELAMVFQDPMTALNPLIAVGSQVTEALQLHLGLDASAARSVCLAHFEALGIPDAPATMAALPTQLSKGMAQRVLVALALAGEPALLVADEPTASLDPGRQQQVVEVLAQARQTRGMGLVLIAHDLDSVAQHADELLVLHAGQVAEWAPTDPLAARAQHPYTLALQQAARTLREGHAQAASRDAQGTSGGRERVGSPWTWPSGCRYRTRCPRATAECAAEAPPLKLVAEGHRVACFHPGSGP